MKINELREQRTALAREVRDLLDKNPGKEWKPEHQTAYDAKMEDIERIDGEITRNQSAMDLDAERRVEEAAADVGKDRAKKNGRPDPLSDRGIHDAWLRGGIQAMSPEQATKFRNTMSTTTGSQGGYTVPTIISGELIDLLKLFGGMRPVSDVFQTSTGADLNFPTTDGTAETGEIVAQNVQAATADPTFGSVTISTYKFSSKTITVPIELLQDTVIDIEAFLNKRIVQRLGRSMNSYFTTGTGSSQPYGVAARAASGKVGTTGQTLTVIYNDLLDLLHAVDPAYRDGGSCRFMMNDGSLKVVRKLVDSNSRPLFIPNWDTSITQGVPATLCGYPIQINQDVATMAANAKSILFGDFSYYKIRDVMGLTLFRFTDSVFMTYGQVGFLAWARAGGNLVDTTAVKYYANSAT